MEVLFLRETIHTVVFQAQEGGGNPCPVTLFSGEMDAQEMQQMTKEFGQESAFVTKSTHPDCQVKARYFVPLHEMEMCIHATVGTTTVLVEKGLAETSPILFETAFGPMQVDWERRDGKIDVGVHQFSPKYKEENPTAEEICRALNIEQSQLAAYPAQSVATSRFKLIVPLVSRTVLDGLHPDFEYLWQLCDRYETTGFYPYAMEQEEGALLFYARQFPKRAGYNEDPATGVAASALGTYLAKHAVLPRQEGWNSFTIMQGFAMGKPSVLCSDVLIQSGQIVKTRVRGNAYLV